MDQVTRRGLLKGGMASLGFLALGDTGLFAAPKDWRPKKKPNLTFGVVSDTHMRCHYDGKSFYSRYDVFFDDQALVEVMKVFKRAKVDAILHCGDITDNGMVREMEFYKEVWDKVYGTDPRPANLICTGNHDVDESYDWAKMISRSNDPAVYKKIRLGPHNIKKEMERIWGEPYEDVWHKTVKGYHFFGFGWPSWPAGMGLGAGEHLPYKGWLYNDTKDEGMSGCAYHHYSLHLTELVRRELEARRLDPKKPFFFATHAFYGRRMRPANYALRRVLGLNEIQFCNGLGFHGHGHGNDAYWRFNWMDGTSFPHVMCSTLAYWKAHNGEGAHPRFAKNFGDGTASGDVDLPKADHALIVRVYDDMIRISRIWVSVKPKHVVGSLGPDWVMPLSGFTPDDHPLREENYVKVIGSPEFSKDAKLEVSLEKVDKVEKIPPEPGAENHAKRETVLRIKIPKADGNSATRVYGYNVVVMGEDGKKVKKSVYARGYCMGVGFEPEGGVTTLEIPQADLPPGKKLTIAVRPCSSLATKGKAIASVLNMVTGNVRSLRV